MSQVTATAEQVSRWVRREAVPEASWNPVYRALAGGSAATEAAAPNEASLDLVRRQLTAPALLVVAVTHTGRTHRLRIGPAPTAATVERADDDQPSHWSESSVDDVPAMVTGLFEEARVELAPAQLSSEGDTEALRLTPAQGRTAYAALLRGLPAGEAFAAIPDLDDALRDALTATGPRISLSLTLHDPHGRVTERPVTWSRLWVTGRKGLYRMDQPAGPALAASPVGGGDVLGTLLPVVEQGRRFATACASAGGGR